MRLLLVLAIAASVSGCAGIKPSLPYKAYTDTEAPAERTALVVGEGTPVSYARGYYSLQIECIDGASTEAVLTYEDGKRWATQVRLLPGRHYLKFFYERYISYGNVLHGWGNLWLDAEAGHEYRLQRDAETWSAEHRKEELAVSIVDASTLRPVGGVTGSDPDRKADAKTCE